MEGTQKKWKRLVRVNPRSDANKTKKPRIEEDDGKIDLNYPFTWPFDGSSSNVNYICKTDPNGAIITTQNGLSLNLDWPFYIQDNILYLNINQQDLEVYNNYLSIRLQSPLTRNEDGIYISCGESIYINEGKLDTKVNINSCIAKSNDGLGISIDNSLRSGNILGVKIAENGGIETNNNGMLVSIDNNSIIINNLGQLSVSNQISNPYIDIVFGRPTLDVYKFYVASSNGKLWSVKAFIHMVFLSGFVNVFTVINIKSSETPDANSNTLKFTFIICSNNDLLFNLSELPPPKKFPLEANINVFKPNFANQIGGYKQITDPTKDPITNTANWYVDENTEGFRKTSFIPISINTNCKSGELIYGPVSILRRDVSEHQDAISMTFVIETDSWINGGGDTKEVNTGGICFTYQGETIHNVN